MKVRYKNPKPDSKYHNPKASNIWKKKIQNWTSHSKWKIGQTDGDNLWAAQK